MLPTNETPNLKGKNTYQSFLRPGTKVVFFLPIIQISFQIFFRTKKNKQEY